MNRRTFLQATAITTLLPALPVIAKKQQWISLKEQMPQVGQRFLLLELFKKNAHFITAGERKDVNNSFVMEDTVYTAKFGILPEFSYDSYYNNKNVLHYNKKIMNQHSLYEVAAYPWVKYDDIVFESCDISLYYVIDENMWWIPIEDEYPKELPLFPKYVVLWIPFKNHMPKHNDRIEIKDQIEITAVGWYQESKIDEECCWFVPEERYKEWLNINLVSINKPFWSWRYVS